MTTKAALFLVFFFIGICCQAQPETPLLVATIVNGVPVPTYPPPVLECAIEAAVGGGVDITDASIEPLGAGWVLLGTGTAPGGNGFTIGYGLIQHATQLHVSSAGIWDQCAGVECSSCKVLLDNEGDGYCDCKRKVTQGAYCNHTTGSGSNIVNAIQACD